MDDIAKRQRQNQEMLAALGITNVEELFASIPRELLQPSPSENDGLSEFEALKLAETIAAENSFPSFVNYLGGGAYEHHIPAIVGAICSKSEFLTAYTPYQAEMSQGMLQAIFEFQSVVCALTGMDVANASVYDGASACAEAILMALRLRPERTKVVLAATLHPSYRAVVEQYLHSHRIEIVTAPCSADGKLDHAALMPLLDDQVAALLVQSPNFLGIVEDVAPAFSHAKLHNSLAILCANPLAYGLYASAGELGADIAVGDMQPFGLSLQFGGPYVGYMACRQELVRQLPGRLVGETVDTKGRRGFVLTLQAREQHIRREKATSNICTNQALAALASLVAILWYGREGVRRLALSNYQRACHLRNLLSQLPGIQVDTNIPILNEFVVRLSKPVEEVQRHFRVHSIEPGLSLAKYLAQYKDCLLVCVTETKNLEQLEHYAAVLANA